MRAKIRYVVRDLHSVFVNVKCAVSIDTGSVGAVSVDAAVTVSLIAAALIVYAVVEAFALAVRVSRPKPEPKYKGVYDG